MAARCGMRATRQFKGQPGFGGATRQRARFAAEAVTKGQLTDAELQAWRTDFDARLQIIQQHPEQNLGHIEEAVAAAAKEPLRYVVYRFVNNEKVDLGRNDRIVSIQQATEFTDPDAKKYKECSYVVTAMDRMWNESKGSNAGVVK